MNYGEQFVEIYNKKFASICLNAKTQFESYYNTNYSFVKVEKVLIKQLVEEIDKLLKSNNLEREIYETCDRIIRGSRNHYTSEVTLSLINDEIYEIFDQFTSKSKEKVNYEEFIYVFANRKAIYDYFSFLEKNKEELTKIFDNQKIGNFFNVVKANNELYKLNDLKKEPQKKDSQKIDPKNKVIQKKKVSVYHLTQNEKMILLHVLLHEFKDSGLHSLSTEYFRVLSLTSECLTEQDVQKANTNHTKYNYFYKGVNASDKPSFEKSIMIDEILKKIETVKNIEKFKRALVRYKNSK
ncbi:hypothetical protein ACSIGC_16115 [Tenacibaculum sp. ZS6-P6]|uniref:hypothetical protein n=1 Tax=Tenacibaculum sp. ZS6-P6 TaxID=3447503 RepID=UPI003F954152